LTIDGLSPVRVVRPRTTDELSGLLSSEKGTVIPVGAATQQYFGNPLRRFDCAVDLTQLNRITEYVPGDLTIHVEAGVTLAELQRTLALNNQFLPLNPWSGSDATIGGIAAANAQGPLRAVGTIRDWIIGMKVVEVSGTVSKTGGRVVKNVTGYDLAKLYTGSIGSLAIIAEISLKLRSAFSKTATAIARCDDRSHAEALLKSVRTGPLQPISCEWVGPENEVWLRFGEHPKAVDWQLENLPKAEWRTIEGADEAVAWEKLSVRYRELGPIVLKVIGLSSNVAEIVDACKTAKWIAHALNGIVFAGLSDPNEIGRIREKYRAVIERAPLEVRRKVPTFGLDETSYQLMRKMKNAFDPENRLNPGRHVDGER
jgi:glycolate oxidase FAD binding subunit